MDIKLRISLKSDIGCVRTDNEDMIIVNGEKYRDCADEFMSLIENNGRFVAAVADGMGGHNAGEVASEMALGLFDDFIVGLPPDLSDNDFQHLLDNEVKKIHNSFVSYGIQHPECAGMGTTLVAWLTYENRIYLVNVGDSRAYRLRNSFLCQITTDHSEQNRLHDPTLPSNLIYNCLGGGGVAAFADVTEITGKVFEGDTFLLCSDGLSDMLSDEEIEASMNARCQAESLVEAAKKKGGIDNLSAVIITIKNKKK